MHELTISGKFDSRIKHALSGEVKIGPEKRLLGFFRNKSEPWNVLNTLICFDPIVHGMYDIASSYFVLLTEA